MKELERFPKNSDWESDAPFGLRIPHMANASHSGETHFVGQNAQVFEGAELTDLYGDGDPRDVL
jgi:hypothetical protein